MGSPLHDQRCPACEEDLFLVFFDGKRNYRGFCRPCQQEYRWRDR